MAKNENEVVDATKARLVSGSFKNLDINACHCYNFEYSISSKCCYDKQ